MSTGLKNTLFSVHIISDLCGEGKWFWEKHEALVCYV